MTALAEPPATEEAPAARPHAHPYQLHAHAAAWNLHHARLALAVAIERETAQRRADAAATAAARNIQAWRPQPGRSSGGHGDPVGGTIAGVDHAWTGDLRPSKLSRIARRIDTTLRWLADELRVWPAPDPLDRLSSLEWTPPVAAHLARWLGELDHLARGALQLDPAEEPVPGNPPCPSCGLQLLHTLTAVPGRPVVCRAELCLCAGDVCGCRMPVREPGVVHIWATLP